MSDQLEYVDSFGDPMFLVHVVARPSGKHLRLLVSRNVTTLRILESCLKVFASEIPTDLSVLNLHRMLDDGSVGTDVLAHRTAGDAGLVEGSMMVVLHKRLSE